MKKQTIIFTAIFLTLGCFAFSSRTQAVSPPPDGCYAGFTTAEGCNALNFLTSGAANTAVGWRSLFSNTDGSFNTGFGAGTPFSLTRAEPAIPPLAQQRSCLAPEASTPR
jgi:hypothetical protein